MARREIVVSVRSELPEYAYGEPLLLEYSVENRSSAPRFVVSESFVAEVTNPSELHLLVGEPALPSDLFYFDFEAPHLVRLAGRSRRSFGLRVALPLIETELDADGNAYDSDVPLSGMVTLLLRVGFLDSRFSPRSANPWGEFVAAQRLSNSARTRVRIQSR